MLSEALYLGSHVKGDICLGWVKLADELPEQLDPVLVTGLGKLVAKNLVEAGIRSL